MIWLFHAEGHASFGNLINCIWLLWTYTKFWSTPEVLQVSTTDQLISRHATQKAETKYFNYWEKIHLAAPWKGLKPGQLVYKTNPLLSWSIKIIIIICPHKLTLLYSDNLCYLFITGRPKDNESKDEGKGKMPSQSFILKLFLNCNNKIIK